MGEGASPGEADPGGHAALLSMNTEVAALLGQCLLRLQYSEVMLKALVAEGAFSGSPESLGKSQAKRRQKVQMMTLGGLVSEFLRSGLGGGAGGAPEEEASPPSEGASVSVKFGIDYPPETLVQIESELREMVALRNHLVHGFLAAHDLTSVEGCGRARDRLQEDLTRIDRHRAQVMGWAEEFQELRKQTGLRLQDPAVVKRLTSGEGGDLILALKPSGDGRG